jgi:TctA family transporter
MDTLEGLRLGFETATSGTMLLYSFLGVLLGTFVGVLPGIGAMAAISLLLPITYYIPSTAALAMLAGIYYGTQYGGSVAAILLRLPGTPSNAVTCLEGYPMARRGKAGLALSTAMLSSFAGSILGLALLIAIGPLLSRFALNFGPAEYFSLMLLGLIAAASVGTGGAARNLAMVVLGIIMGLVGMDINSGVQRLNFGVAQLIDGISLLALAMGLFGISEIIGSLGSSTLTATAPQTGLRESLPDRATRRRMVPPILRGTAIGSFFGTMPGVGAGIASFMSYAVEKRMASGRTAEGEAFGTGAIEGIAGPESANNAGAITAFVPTLTLGIPGDVVMALMLGAMLLHGIQPGPLMMQQNPEVFWGLVVSFGIGNLMLLVLNLPLIRVWVAVLRIPFSALYPAIVVFTCLGVYSVSNSVFDIYLVAAFGALGYALVALGFSPAPLLLGFILGPLMEENLRRALLISRGRLTPFLESPITLTLLAASAAIIVASVVLTLRDARAERARARPAAETP